MNDNLKDLKKEVDKLQKEIQGLAVNGSRARDIPVAKHGLNVKGLSLQEKKRLGANIRKLEKQFLRGVWEIITDDNENTNVEKDLTFNINDLETKTNRELERYVKYKLDYTIKKKLRIENQRRQINLLGKKDKILPEVLDHLWLVF